jgi:hypothetical protein
VEEIDGDGVGGAGGLGHIAQQCACLSRDVVHHDFVHHLWICHPKNVFIVFANTANLCLLPAGERE